MRARLRSPWESWAPRDRAIIAAPAISASKTDLRTLVQAQAGAAALSRALVRIDAPDADQVVVVFGAVAFADWHNWIAGLKSQHVRLDAGRGKMFALCTATNRISSSEGG